MTNVQARLIDTRVKNPVVKLYKDLCYFFPDLTHFYGGSGSPDHMYKRCLDAMVYDSSNAFVRARGMTNAPYSKRIALGNEVLAFSRKNAQHYGINGIIWNGKVYGFPHDDAPFGRNYYRGPRNVARNYTLSAHDDHLHYDIDCRDFVSLIPGSAGPVPFPKPDSNEAYLDKIAIGVTDSDTVWYIQSALNKVGVKVALTADYDAATVAAVKAYQAKLGDKPQFQDGILGPKQTLKLFADAKLELRLFRSSSAGGLVTS